MGNYGIERRIGASNVQFRRASTVDVLLWEQEVGGSNPPVPTSYTRCPKFLLILTLSLQLHPQQYQDHGPITDLSNNGQDLLDLLRVYGSGQGIRHLDPHLPLQQIRMHHLQVHQIPDKGVEESQPAGHGIGLHAPVLPVFDKSA